MEIEVKKYSNTGFKVVKGAVIPRNLNNGFTFPKGTEYFLDSMVFRVREAFKDSSIEYRKIYSQDMGDQVVQLSQLVDDMQSKSFRLLKDPNAKPEVTIATQSKEEKTETKQKKPKLKAKVKSKPKSGNRNSTKRRN